MTNDARKTRALLRAFKSGAWIGVIGEKAVVLQINPPRLVVAKTTALTVALLRSSASKRAR